MNIIDLIKTNNPALLKRKELVGKVPALPLIQEKQYYEAIKKLIIDPFTAQLTRLTDSAEKLIKDVGFIDDLETYTQPVTVNEQAVNAIVLEATQATTLFTIGAVYESINKAVGFRIPVQPVDINNQIREFAKINVREIASLNTRQADGLYRKIADIYYNQPKDFKQQILTLIQNATKLSEGQAMTLAVTQINRLRADITRLHHEALQIDKYRWWTKQDERVRPTHRTVHGKIVAYDKPPSITGGKHAGQDWNCRCRAVPVLFTAESMTD